MNPFPLINDKNHSIIRAFAAPPKDGYEVGDFFVVQHGPVRGNLFVFEVLEVGESGRATRAKLVAEPSLKAVQNSEPLPQPEVFVSGDICWGVCLVRYLAELAMTWPGTIGAAFVDVETLTQYRVPGDDLITHSEGPMVHKLQFINGSFLFLFNTADLEANLHSSQRFNFVSAFDVSDAAWNGILAKCTREGVRSHWRISKMENKGT